MTRPAPGRETIVGQLNYAETIIANALNDQTIAGLLAGYGYDSATIQNGQVRYQQAFDLQRAQEREYSEQYAATDTVEAARQQAEALYLPHLKVARVALKNERGAREALMLDGNRKSSLTGWIDQARQFYVNALATPGVLIQLARYNITANLLETGLAAVNALESARQSQHRERGEAQDATKARDAALDAMMEWVGDFVEIARVALAGQPQLLEKLGIVEPS